jgi:hypothetical protein
MGDPTLTGTMRIRVVIVAVSGTLLALVLLPLEIMTIVNGGTAGQIAFAFGVGVVLPALAAALMWWQVRRWRHNPEIRRRQPRKAAARVLLFGNLGVVILVSLLRDGWGMNSWQGWGITLVVFTVGAGGVWLVAKRLDPRLHFFRRPDPLPPGQEPEGPAPKPW